MDLVQFQVKVSSGNPSFLAEVLGDSVESIWWDEEGNVSGILSGEKKAQFEVLFKIFCTETDLSFPPVHFFKLEDKDWLKADQKILKPLEVGDFFIYPPHFDGEIPYDKTAFKIDSPDAFGSGHHETTKNCLKVLQELSSIYTPTRAVDIGCGSGILAMAIAALWDISVYATDTCRNAVFAARKNILENRVKNIEVVECAGLEHLLIEKNAPFDLIVANIHSNCLTELAPSVSKPLSPKGFVLLSGILEEQKEEVLKSYFSYGMQLKKAYQDGQWITLLLSLEEVSF